MLGIVLAFVAFWISGLVASTVVDVYAPEGALPWDRGRVPRWARLVMWLAAIVGVLPGVVVEGAVRGAARWLRRWWRALGAIWAAVLILVLSAACGPACDAGELVNDGEPPPNADEVVAAVEAMCGPVSGVVRWRPRGEVPCADMPADEPAGCWYAVACGVDVAVAYHYDPSTPASEVDAWQTAEPHELCHAACGAGSNAEAEICVARLRASVGR